MRELKFRAWDKTHHRMVKDILVADKCVIQRYHDYSGQICFRTLETYYDARKDFIPMQYTGLKDKNGVEIYEGDIVKDGASEIGRLWKISITPEYGITFTLFEYREKIYYYEDFNEYHQNNFEVIGNIYETMSY